MARKSNESKRNCMNLLFIVSLALTLCHKSAVQGLSPTSSMPSYTRPGVAAAARLANLDGPNRAEVWEKIGARYDDMIAEKGGKKLKDLDQFCEELAKTKLRGEGAAITKDDLLMVVEWKFAKGKPRYALMKHLNSNTESSVLEASRKAFAASSGGNAKDAINEMCVLRGVGPATASAVLSLHRGDLFSFMDDEVIEAIYDGKRGYTLKIYLEVNSRCAELAKELGEDFTPRGIGRTLWTAARLCASGEPDLTLADDKGAVRSGRPASDLGKTGTDSGRRKRRKKKA